MDYGELARVYENLGKTTKRLEKRDILAELFRNAGKDLKDVVYLAQGKVFPLWDERKIGFSSRLMIKALNQATGITGNEIEKSLNKYGDLGKVAEDLVARKKQHTLMSSTLTVDKVFSNIRKLATMEGQGTVNRKTQLVSELITNATKDEVRYIVGLVLEELRVGVSDGIVRDAIAMAFNVDPNEIEVAHDTIGDYGEVALMARDGKLHELKLEAGRAMKVMLAILVKDVKEGLDTVGKPAEIEQKYDGFRCELHKKKGKISLFTRRMEEVTHQFPEVVEYVKENVKGDDFILDSEIVGYDRKTKKYMPFQKISQRIRRKYNIQEMAEKFPVEVNVFDCMLYGGKTMLEKDFAERRKLLEKVVKQKEKKIVLAKNLISDNEKEILKFYKEALKAGHEGVMFKNLHAKYRPGRYVGYMAKLKEVLDTLDLVIIAAEWGHGKRAKTLSSYIVACKNEDGDLVEIGKVSTGVKEKEAEVTFETITDELKPLITAEKGNVVELKPKIIIEVAFEEIQKSPTYTSGMALRFPRVIRFRLDKGLDDVSTLDDAERIYNAQRGRQTAF